MPSKWLQPPNANAAPRAFLIWQVKPLGDLMTAATLAIYLRCAADLLPTPDKPHYLFNLRDISRVFQGVLQSNRTVFDTRDSMIRLWVHEANRVFADRLTNKPDREYFQSLINEKLGALFQTDLKKLHKDQLNPFGNFMRASGDGGKVAPYEELADPKALKVAMTSLYKKHVQDQKVGDSGADADLQREYNRQREYLEKSVECLKRKLAKDTKMHHVENARLMRENVSLLREINDLRRSKKWVDSEKAAAAAAAGGRGVDPVAQEEAWREVDMQQETIFDLTERMQQLQQEMGIDMDRGPESELGQVIPG